MKKLVSVALAAAALAAPAAIASARGNDRAKGPRTVEYEFRGVVASDASTVAVDVMNVRGLSKHARRSLAGASTVTITLDANTRFRGPHGLSGVQVKLSAGDRVTIVVRAVRGLAAADLPAAKVVFDRGQVSGGATLPIPDPVVTPPAPGPAPPPVVPPPPPLFL
jgi:hypothetical protein